MFDALVNYFTGTYFLFQFEMVVRIIIAFLCGAFIGHERKTRGKGAGTRTHSIVAIASCLMMIVSQYGFQDFLEHFNGTGININHDPSRIAAQIVTGIGFVGAGMIFVHKKTITGLTTAAGVWATAGIGMSVGAGMYFISISTTVIIIVVQFISHQKLKFFSPSTEINLLITVKDKEKALNYINDIIEDEDIHTNSVEITYKDDNLYDISITASTIHEFDKMKLANRLYLNDTIVSVKI